jgi:hypothetical protein
VRRSHTYIQPPHVSTSGEAGTLAPEVLGVPLPHIRLAVCPSQSPRLAQFFERRWATFVGRSHTCIEPPEPSKRV